MTQHTHQRSEDSSNSDSSRLARIETKLDTLLLPAVEALAAHDSRISSLETFRGYAKGVAAALVFILSLFGIEKLIK